MYLEDYELWLLIVTLSIYIEKEEKNIDPSDASAVAGLEDEKQLLKRLNAMHEAVQEKAIDIRVTKNR